MDINKFSLIFLSGVMIMSTTMIHYGYYDYIQKNMIAPNYNIFYANFFLLLMAWVGLVNAVGIQQKTLSYLLIGSVSILCISTLFMMYQDVAFLKGNKNTHYKINILKPSVSLLLCILGWFMVGFVIPKGALERNERKISTMMMVFMILGLYELSIKSRKNGITDHPGYVIVLLMWMMLAYLGSGNKNEF